MKGPYCLLCMKTVLYNIQYDGNVYVYIIIFSMHESPEISEVQQKQRAYCGETYVRR